MTAKVHANHGRDHLPTGMDPIPASPAEPFKMFRRGVTGDITCPTSTNTTLTFGTSYISVGSPFTTPDSQTFTLALGVWQITMGLTVSYTLGGNTTAVTEATMVNDTNNIATKQFFLDGFAHNGGTVTFDKTALVSGNVTAVKLHVDLFNFEGFDLKVIAAGDLSYLEGVLLNPA